MLLFAFLYVVAFVFIEKWDKYVVDVILSRFPDADFGFLVFLIALLVILLYCVYKHLRPWKQRTVRWFSPDLMIAYNIILSSVIVWLTISSEYVWHGYGCFAYALLIPVASAGYLAEYMLYVRFCNKRSGDDMLSYTSGKYQQNENSNTTELNTKGQNVQTGNVKTNKEQINKRKKNERKRCKRRK